ncbi:hypothetical protein BKA04_000131 [Cryobacterium mesophilum]|uniref:hypothetical protein n=1 Tax=Terrimesophilobacter mesophilus TaxID=433647 RepID=UPI0014258EE1|nr:hypothetical protein [Terrimesophilobacter mesophilus]MBB5631908.1 hypothetical protein [Terrimesophilobacter mesophilus]
MFAFISQRWFEKFPRGLDTTLFWVAGTLLVIGVLGFVGPYLLIFFGARPA